MGFAINEAEERQSVLPCGRHLRRRRANVHCPRHRECRDAAGRSTRVVLRAYGVAAPSCIISMVVAAAANPVLVVSASRAFQSRFVGWTERRTNG